mgnify:CR=1 FL=1
MKKSDEDSIIRNPARKTTKVSSLYSQYVPEYIRLGKEPIGYAESNTDLESSNSIEPIDKSFKKDEVSEEVIENNELNLINYEPGTYFIIYENRIITSSLSKQDIEDYIESLVFEKEINIVDICVFQKIPIKAGITLVKNND